MWKESSDTSRSTSDPATDDAQRSSPSSSRDDKQHPKRVKVTIIRPDGSSRKVKIAGHFREEHLCSLVDDELCRLNDGESLILHLFHPDDQLTESLRQRWRDSLSDSRRVFCREVLGPTGSRQLLTKQLRRIKERMVAGECVNVAIRSPQIAKVARGQLRKMLLISQQFDDSLLNLSVSGDDDQQQEILGHLEGVGMIRARDYREFVARHSDRRWRPPWIDLDLPKQQKRKRRQRQPKTSNEAVSDWIKRVEEEREHPRP